MHREYKRGSTRGYRHHERLLVAYVDGELSDRAAARVTAHLAGCAACREQEDRLRTLTDRLAETLAAAPLSAAEEAALARVQLPSERPRRPPRRRASVVTSTVRGLAGWARGTAGACGTWCHGKLGSW